MSPVVRAHEKYVAVCEMSSHYTTHTSLWGQSISMIYVNLSFKYWLAQEGISREGTIKVQSLHHFTLLLLQLRSITTRILTLTQVSCKYGFHSWICIYWSVSHPKHWQILHLGCMGLYVSSQHTYRLSLSFFPWSFCLHSLAYWCWYITWQSAQMFVCD